MNLVSFIPAYVILVGGGMLGLLAKYVYRSARRDWLAGQALAGLIAYSPAAYTLEKEPAELARQAYRVADAMLEERKHAK